MKRLLIYVKKLILMMIIIYKETTFLLLKLKFNNFNKIPGLKLHQVNFMNFLYLRILVETINLKLIQKLIKKIKQMRLSKIFKRCVK